MQQIVRYVSAGTNKAVRVSMRPRGALNYTTFCWLLVDQVHLKLIPPESCPANSHSRAQYSKKKAMRESQGLENYVDLWFPTKGVQVVAFRRFVVDMEPDYAHNVPRAKQREGKQFEIIC